MMKSGNGELLDVEDRWRKRRNRREINKFSNFEKLFKLRIPKYLEVTYVINQDRK